MSPSATGAAVVVLGAIWFLTLGGAPPEATPVARPAPQAKAVTLYDPKPDHPWNRLHRALFVRTTRDGEEHGHDTLDPLLWPETNHVLVGPSHKEALARLDDLLAPGALDKVRDPLKRAVLQRDLWAVFDWAADPFLSRYGRTQSRPGVENSYPPGAHPAARKALQVRLAPAILKLGLPVDAITKLPDNYAAAVGSKAYPTKFDPEHPDTPFLPPDLYDPAGPWVCVGGRAEDPPLALAHTRFFAGRSAFLVFINLPGGRKATRDYLATLAKVSDPWVISRRERNDGTTDEFASLRDGLPQFPAGTQLALARRMLVITDQGNLWDTSITESVQFRVYRRVPQGGYIRRHEDAKLDQAFFEFELRREDLFAGKGGGLRAVPGDEPVPLALQFLTGYPDAFEAGREEARHVRRMPLRDTCAACHASTGVYGVNSFTRQCSTNAGTRHDLSFRQTTFDDLDKGVVWKRESYLFGFLKGLGAR